VELHIDKPVEEADPSPDEFIDVSDEPHEIQPLEKLIQYPEVARRSGLEGKVTVQALIGKDGSVEKVDVLKSDYDIFKDAAIQAVKNAKFTPARQNGTPLKVWITRTINFKLH
jgi:protein TonB